MSKIKILFIFTLISCSRSVETSETDKNQFQPKRRESIVLDYLHLKGIDGKGGQLNVYFFSDNTCMSCNRDKLQQSTALFRSTTIPSVIVFDSESMLAEKFNNSNVRIVSEKPEELSRKGLRFGVPCLFIYRDEKFVKSLDLDLTFFESLDSVKVAVGL